MPNSIPSPSPTDPVQDPPTPNPVPNLERFLAGDLSAIPSLESLLALRLEAHAHSVLPQGHPYRVACKSAFVLARTRHELIKREVLELLRAWNAAGIEPVLYKGFALAEFSYPQPGTRFHGDVDVLVRPDEFRQALGIGRSLGWNIPQAFDHWLFASSNPHELTLKRPGASVYIDLHQRLVPTSLRSTDREHALTMAAHVNSRPVEWEGTRIRLLTPEDAFIFGLVISRCWSGDAWQLKAHDLLDGLALIQRHGLTRAQVLNRGRTLRVSRTVAAYLERCDPFDSRHPRLDSRTIPPLAVLRLELATAAEHVPLVLARTINFMLFIPAILRVLPLLPLWFKVRGVLRQNPDLASGVVSLTRGESARSKRTNPLAMELQTSVVWWLLRRLKATHELTWPIVIYLVLYRQGAEVNLKVGRRDASIRAWVEVDGVPLPEFELEHGGLEGFEIILQTAEDNASGTAGTSALPIDPQSSA
jgi:Uncharacterised nucleotidyltransferase